MRLTRDGHLVCVHDRRLNRTSNGQGLVSARTLAELDALDFGSWHPGCTEEAGGEVPVTVDPARTGCSPWPGCSTRSAPPSDRCGC